MSNAKLMMELLIGAAVEMVKGIRPSSRGRLQRVVDQITRRD